MLISMPAGTIRQEWRINRPTSLPWERAWSPNGKWLVVHQAATSAGEEERLFLINSVPTDATQGQEQITITGTVMDVSFSARLIMLTEPVDGIDSLALIEESRINFDNGDPRRDIERRMRIQTTGTRGDNAALLPTEVRRLPE